MALGFMRGDGGVEQMALFLKYRGPSVDDGKMDVYEAAGSMVAFSDFVVRAAQETYGKGTKVKAEVSGFRQGSFETDLVFQLCGVAATIFATTPNIADVIDVAREALDLYKFLKGDEPKTVQTVDASNLRVENRDGDVVIVNANTFNLTVSVEGGRAAEEFVQKPLLKGGVDSVEIRDAVGMITNTITKAEAKYFKPISQPEEVVETQVPMLLNIEVLPFKENLQWRLSDGSSSFLAEVEDADFLQRVDNGEAFSKGDTLHCDVKVRQTKEKGQLKITRTVVRVIAHTPEPIQQNLLGDDSGGKKGRNRRRRKR